MSKIQMTTPLVEMDGDEMTRILWLHLIPQKQQRNMELQSNVQRSLQMQRVWMNMI